MKLSDPTDEELMLLCKRKAAGAFELLYTRHRRALSLYLLRMTRDQGLAEEIFQDTMLKVARAADAYEPRGLFRPWLFRIATHHCLNVLASADTRRRASRVVFLEPDAWARQEARDPAPPEQLERRELRARVLRALDGLEPRYRAAMLLRQLLEMPLAEIAETLEIPVGTVKTYLHRGRERLRETLARDPASRATEGTS